MQLIEVRAIDALMSKSTTDPCRVKTVIERYAHEHEP